MKWRLPNRDPADVRPISLPWGDELSEGETIIGVTLSVSPDGLTLDAPAIDGSTVTAMVSGGIVKTVYVITCEITTSAGHTINRSARLEVRDL